jgi:16S rRNA (guanine(1405)-N(7))-methyltransferase
MDFSDQILLDLVQQVKKNIKYYPISNDLICQIGTLELRNAKNLKDAVKTTRSKLHQIGSAFQEKPIPYQQLITSLAQLPNEMEAPENIAFFRTCLPMHASTRERLPFAEHFFRETLAPIAPVESILDLACGFSPLCLPWMPVTKEVSYFGFDIYEDMIGFLSQVMAHMNVKHNFTTADLSLHTPTEKTHVTFLLKTIPCLEQVDKSIGKRLLEEIQSENILVSFPSQSLSGKSKGMSKNYEAHFLKLVTEKPWKITKTVFPNEIAFLIQK